MDLIFSPNVTAAAINHGLSDDRQSTDLRSFDQGEAPQDHADPRICPHGVPFESRSETTTSTSRYQLMYGDHSIVAGPKRLVDECPTHVEND